LALQNCKKGAHYIREYTVNSAVQALGIGAGFRKYPVDMDFSYMDIRIYFHLLCNYLQTYLLNKIFPNPTTLSPPPPKKKPQ